VNISNPKEYKQAVKDFINFVKQKVQNDENFKKELIAQGLKPEEIREKISERANSAAQKAARAEALTQMTMLRQVAAKGKIEEVSEWLTDFTETGKKLVLFVNHQEILKTVKKILQDQGINVVTFSGEDSEKERDRSVTSFQEDANCQVIICSIKAGGEGITLTAASDVAFLEVDWKPSQLSQCEDRCHRMGQKNAVNVYYFHAHGTIDDYIFDLIEAKRKVVSLDKNCDDNNIKTKTIEEFKQASIVNELWKKLVADFCGKETDEDIN
jgi:SWI/SNF-related matrix-associated actin-dependent regulator 1 of chromatin subfamily A